MNEEHEHNHHHHDEHHHEHFHIVVNGDPFTTEKKELSYEDVVHFAFPKDSGAPEVRYTVEYVEPNGKEGTLIKGEKVHTVNDMSFDVDNTYKS